MAGVTIDIRGVPEVQAFLENVDKGANATLQKAASAGAKALKPFVQAAAPSERGWLRRSISARQAARQRPAAVVTARAFYRHMVIGGTKDHGPRTAPFLVFTPGQNGYSGNTPSAGHGTVVASHVRGTKPRPFMAEGFAAGQGAMDAAIDAVIDTAIGAGK